MAITERQEKLLNAIVQEHIKSAQPISSQLLEKKYKFGIKPAMIRIEMQRLTDNGYLVQPHLSAGRVPTDKGYRFFVDRVLADDFSEFGEDFFNEISQMEKEMRESLKFAQNLTKRVAELTLSLAMSYWPKEDILLKEGWEEIFQEPEFEDEKYRLKFLDMVKDWEETIQEIENCPEVKIYIGKENPYLKAKDFSIIVSGCRLPKMKEGILAILGPKRMTYPKNISLINCLNKLLEDF